MPTDAGAEVLLVDDDPQIIDLYVRYLEDSFAVRTATSGREALDRISEAVDIVLLDRRMPEMSGDEVLETIRDDGYDCRVAMVTAVRPDVDIVDMAFDDYLVKPVTPSKLRNTIDSLLGWDEYDALLREYFETAQKIETLEKGQPRERLESSDEYRALREELATIRSEADAAHTSLVPEMLSTIADSANPSEGSDRSLQFRSDR